VFISSFDRPNLSLAVLPGQDRWKAIERIVGRHAGKCGIIYCNSRAGAEKLAAKLQGIGIGPRTTTPSWSPEERSRCRTISSKASSM
jgi:ATP-dependent DNA helicase RecQ